MIAKLTAAGPQWVRDAAAQSTKTYPPKVEVVILLQEEQLTVDPRRQTPDARTELDPQVRIGGDSGRPVVLNGDEDSNAAGFSQLAKTMIKGLAASGGPKGPWITIED